MAFFLLYFFVIKCPKSLAKQLASLLDKRFFNQEIFIIPENFTKLPILLEREFTAKEFELDRWQQKKLFLQKNIRITDLERQCLLQQESFKKRPKKSEVFEIFLFPCCPTKCNQTGFHVKQVSKCQKVKVLRSMFVK